jgi:glycosyltransferase involved in cell wall biosynthesis
MRRELELVHGSNPKIQFLGTITGVQKENTLSAVDGIVVPSTWDEVFGIVNVEAFAFGKPVIAARAGGIPELVRDGETGWLVEPGSIADLKRVLELVARNPYLLADKRAACFDEARKYAIDTIVGSFYGLYRELQAETGFHGVDSR